MKVSSTATKINGITPTHVVILGMMLCAESILSNTYERQVLNKMADGLYSSRRPDNMVIAEPFVKLGMSLSITCVNET